MERECKGGHLIYNILQVASPFLVLPHQGRNLSQASLKKDLTGFENLSGLEVDIRHGGSVPLVPPLIIKRNGFDLS